MVIVGKRVVDFPFLHNNKRGAIRETPLFVGKCFVEFARGKEQFFGCLVLPHRMTLVEFSSIFWKHLAGEGGQVHLHDSGVPRERVRKSQGAYQPQRLRRKQARNRGACHREARELPNKPYRQKFLSIYFGVTVQIVIDIFGEVPRYFSSHIRGDLLSHFRNGEQKIANGATWRNLPLLHLAWPLRRVVRNRRVVSR